MLFSHEASLLKQSGGDGQPRGGSGSSASGGEREAHGEGSASAKGGAPGIEKTFDLQYYDGLGCQDEVGDLSVGQGGHAHVLYVIFIFETIHHASLGGRSTVSIDFRWLIDPSYVGCQKSLLKQLPTPSNLPSPVQINTISIL